MQRPAKATPFQQMIMHALHYRHDIHVHLLFCYDLNLHITSSRGVVFNLDFLCQFLLMGTTLRQFLLMGTTVRAVPSKIHAFSTNYHACIAANMT